MRRSAFLSVAALMAFGSLAMAQPPSPTRAASADTAAYPEWDKLSPTQRDALIGPLRDRWNQNAEGRARMYEHAQRWRTMTPEQRANARRGMQRFDRMDPAQRERSRAVFDKMQSLPPEQRKAFREQWKAMSPEQRRDWLRANAPAETPRDPP